MEMLCQDNHQQCGTPDDNEVNTTGEHGHDAKEGLMPEPHQPFSYLSIQTARCDRSLLLKTPSDPEQGEHRDQIRKSISTERKKGRSLHTGNRRAMVRGER